MSKSIEEDDVIQVPLEEKIRNRNNWLKVLVVGLLTLVLVFKIIQGNISFEVLEFSDLLSMMLAFFAIGLSVAFYFRATDSSNKFYDNSYKFTKEISVNLERIESSFGERLRNLDETYAYYRQGFDNLAKSSPQKNTEVRKVDEENLKAVIEERDKIKDERDKLFEELAMKAQLQAEEKELIIKQMNQYMLELNKKDNAVKELSKRISNNKKDRVETSISEDIPFGIVKFMNQKVIQELDKQLIRNSSMTSINSVIRNRLMELPDAFLYDLQNYNIMDENLNLTRKGYKLIKNIAFDNYVYIPSSSKAKVSCKRGRILEP